jgi:glycosyltransferase involved in cell wall biosynthesis
MPRPLKVGILTTDNRDHWRKYDLPDPVFGPAIAAVLEGFTDFPEEIEAHVISVSQKPLASPARLAPNIFYHSLVVPKFGWLRSGYQGCIRAVRAKVRALGLDLVHGEGTERDCAMEAVFSGRPNLITLHGNMRSVARAMQAPLFSYHWFHSFLEAFALRRTDLVLCNSFYTERLVRPLTPKVQRMPNAVRKIFYDPLPAPILPAEKKFQILVVGLVCPYKQPLEILQALKLWHQGSHPAFHCRFIGALSGDKKYCQAFTKELDAAKTQGWADHRTEISGIGLRDLMDQSDILIHIPTEEAFGLVVAEAMLRGLHIVAGRTGGVTDFQEIYPGIRMVNPKNPAEWLLALPQVNSQKPPRVCRQSWNFLKFHPQEIARRHLEAYHQILRMRVVQS